MASALTLKTVLSMIAAEPVFLDDSPAIFEEGYDAHEQVEDSTGVERRVKAVVLTHPSRAESIPSAIRMDIVSKHEVPSS